MMDCRKWKGVLGKHVPNSCRKSAEGAGQSSNLTSSKRHVDVTLFLRHFPNIHSPTKPYTHLQLLYSHYFVLLSSEHWHCLVYSLPDIVSWKQRGCWFYSPLCPQYRQQYMGHKLYPKALIEWTILLMIFIININSNNFYWLVSCVPFFVVSTPFMNLFLTIKLGSLSYCHTHFADVENKAY